MDAPAAGETIEVVSARGEFLAYAAFSPRSQIRARVLSFDPRASIDAGYIGGLVEQSIERRRALVPADTDAYRLVHGESDGLPGLIVDRFADTLVMQCASTGADRWRDAITAALQRTTGCRRIFERSDLEVRALEGLEPRSGVLAGDEPPACVAIREAGARFLVDVRRGQKTGFFIDQRDNRARVRQVARDAEVLDVFSYTGGFTVAALLGGARRVTAIDSSGGALDQARTNVAANELDAAQVEWIEADAFAMLRTLRDAGRRFDLIVLDPPKFAPTEKHVARAARAYKDINLCALRLLRPGGELFTFSCSGGVTAELFQSIVAGAALDANVQAQIVGRMCASADHPVALTFPEGDYLKGLIVRI